MSFTLLQVGQELKSLNGSGAVSSALSLPSGITLASNRVPRFARFGGYVVVVNTPSRPLLVSDAGAVYPLTPSAPPSAVALSATSTGSLSGDYLALQTYVIKDALGNIITESDYGPAMSAAVTAASQKLTATYVASGETGAGLLGTRLYRTTASGAVYFPWVDDMTNGTSTESGLTDAGLSSVAAADRGPAPDLTLIAEWAGRLWGVDRSDVDHLRYTEAGTSYGWSTLNSIRLPHFGDDAAGITTLIPRRDALGASRLGVFCQITGSTRSNLRPVVVPGGENIGSVSQESAVVFNDVAYFLAHDGVYRWDSSGITCVSNGRVRGWFASDDYFNRAMYWRAFAQFDRTRMKYRLFLASAGSTTIDRWVEYDLLTDTWWGPHRTTACQLACAVTVLGADQQQYAMVGAAEGHLAAFDDSTKSDWSSAGIPFQVRTREFVGGSAERETFFGELSVFAKKQAGTLTVTPYLGDVGDTDATTPFDMTLSNGRERLGRIGVGSSMQVDLSHATINQDVVIYGFTVDPVRPVGRR